MENNIRILMAEDDPFEAELLKLDLVQAGFIIAAQVDKGQDLIDYMSKNEKIDLILVDVMLSGPMDGIEAVSEIRTFSRIPVIYLTAYERMDFLNRAEQTDPVAYLLKPYRKQELHFIIKMSQVRWQREQELSNAREKAEKDLWFMATHDPLTKLPNRTLLLDRLDHQISHAHRNHKSFAVFFLDIDNFKMINDSFGHDVGDDVLRELGKRLEQTIREEDTIARIGGDEFVIVVELQEQNVQGAVVNILEKLKTSITSSIRIEHEEIQLCMSCGVTFYPQDGETPGMLLRNADTAMYRAKNTSGCSYQFYSSDLTVMAQQLFSLETALSRAISGGELVLHYQPQIDLNSQHIVGVEALLRWDKPNRGLVMPDEFIAHAEKSGLIKPMTEWVFETAFRQMKTWIDQGIELDYVAVNMSPAISPDDVLVQNLIDTLQTTGCPPGKVEIEITESHLLNVKTTAHWMQLLKDLHVTIAIDDFGTGFSSLGYLKNLPVDKLKIDRSFIGDLPHTNDSMAIIRALIGLGHNLGLSTIAEGVETQEQHQFLVQESCRLGQGYLYSSPLAADDFSHYYTQTSARLSGRQNSR